MKIPTTIIKAVCDLCTNPKENCFSTCLGCGVDICHQCERAVCEVMHKDMYSTCVQVYCPTCRYDPKITVTELYKALQTIEALRLERAAFNKEFAERAEAAVNHASKLLKEKEQREKNN